MCNLHKLQKETGILSKTGALTCNASFFLSYYYFFTPKNVKYRDTSQEIYQNLLQTC